MAHTLTTYKLARLECDRCFKLDVIDSRATKGEDAWNGWLDLTKPQPNDPLGQTTRLLCPECAHEFKHVFMREPQK